MRPSERTELRRVIKARFELLQEDLTHRQRIVWAAIEDRVKEGHKKEIDAENAQLKKFQDKAAKLRIEITDWMGTLHAKGLQVHYPRVTIELPDHVMLRNEHQLVNDELKRLNIDGKAAKINLSRMELEILETLALDALETDEARAFFDALPTAKQLLPVPADIEKAISSSSTK